MTTINDYLTGKLPGVIVDMQEIKKDRCPHVNTDCIDSRPIKHARRRRRHHCKDCKERFTTIEVVIEECSASETLDTINKFRRLTEPQMKLLNNLIDEFNRYE